MRHDLDALVEDVTADYAAELESIREQLSDVEGELDLGPPVGMSKVDWLQKIAATLYGRRESLFARRDVIAKFLATQQNNRWSNVAKALALRAQGLPEDAAVKLIAAAFGNPTAPRITPPEE